MTSSTPLRPAALAAALLLAFTLSACTQSPPREEGDEPPRAPAPPAAPVPPSPDGVRLYVSDETGGHVVVVDPVAGQVVERIAVGKRPRGIVLSRDGAQLLVALSGSAIAGPNVDESKLPPPDRDADGIGVVDLSARKLLRTYRSGQDPEAFDISLDGTTVYVSNEDAARMSVLDLTTGEVTHRVHVGEEPEAVTLRPDGRVVYVGSESDSEVAAVDTATVEIVGRIKTGARPRGILFTRDGSTAFVANENDASVTVVDASRHAPIASIKIPPVDGAPSVPRPMGLALSPDGNHLYVSLGRAAAIAVIDTRTRQFVRSIEDVGTRPWGIAISPDGGQLYTANGPSADVSIVDLARGTVRNRITTGGSPWGVVAVPVKP